ncbi:MAG: serine O-acetyltransferase [Bacteroidota bacterium]
MNKFTLIDSIQIEKEKINNRFEIKAKTEQFTEKLFLSLFDAAIDLEKSLQELQLDFQELADLVCWKSDNLCRESWEDYLETIPAILKHLKSDANLILENDPAANTLEEIYLAYPGFYAIAVYRLAHPLEQLGLPLIPRLMTEYAHQKTGTDINPGAEIGVPFFIDHATGVVIGETTVIQNNVKIYQGVTLGAHSVAKKMKGKKRHPTIEDNVTIYANATILGGDTIIGKNSVIGGNVWLTQSVAGNSIVSHQAQIQIQSKTEK